MFVNEGCEYFVAKLVLGTYSHFEILHCRWVEIKKKVNIHKEMNFLKKKVQKAFESLTADDSPDDSSTSSGGDAGVKNLIFERTSFMDTAYYKLERI